MQLNIAAETISSFVLILARVGGMVLYAPFFSSLAVPHLVKVLLAVVIAFSLLPLSHDWALPALDAAAIFVGMAGEFLIGVLLGLVGQFFLAVLQLSGQLMGFQIGFGVINVIDPQTQVETPVLSTFKGLLGILVFLMVDAHHWFLEALAASFHLSQPFQGGPPPAVLPLLLDLASGIFTWGFQLAAPVLLVLVLTDILLGITGRAAPQIHVLIVGMPLKVLVGVFILGAGFSILVPAIRRSLDHFRDQLWELLYLLG